jgi:hypothetical protein|tara:strand:- start:927 stop:1862 length:936 start_codon:yes stop_codon:yes gene_type:complete
MLTRNSSFSLTKTKKVDRLFIRLQSKLSSDLRNKGNFLLSTDILRDVIKRDLLRIVVLNIETKLLDLIKKDLDSFDDKSMLIDLVRLSTEDFLTNCYGSKVNIRTTIVSCSLYSQLLIENSNIILKVPFLELLNLDTKVFQKTFDPIYTVASDKFLEVLFDNLIIEISNCVMQIIISEFSIINSIRQVLYRSNFLSSRNFDRFRNSLSWQTRLKRYVNYPKNLYNCQYGIWIIRSKGIYYRTIYANRSEKLFNLETHSLVTVTIIEIYDFLSSRIDEILYLLGDSIRFALGTTIGKFIGIFWRGIIEGLKT